MRFDVLQDLLERCCGRAQGRAMYGHVSKIFCIQDNKETTLVVELIEHTDEVEEEFGAMTGPSAAEHGHGQLYQDNRPKARTRPNALHPSGGEATVGTAASSSTASSGANPLGSMKFGNLGGILDAASEVFTGRSESAWSGREAAAANMAHAAAFASMVDARLDADSDVSKVGGSAPSASGQHTHHSGVTGSSSSSVRQVVTTKLTEPSEIAGHSESSPNASSSVLAYSGQMTAPPKAQEQSDVDDSQEVASPEDDAVPPDASTPQAEPSTLAAELKETSSQDETIAAAEPALPALPAEKQEMIPVRADPLNSEAPPPMAPPSSNHAALPGELSQNGLMHLISALKNSSKGAPASDNKPVEKKQLRIAVPDEETKPATKDDAVMWALLPDAKPQTRGSSSQRKPRRVPNGAPRGALASRGGDAEKRTDSASSFDSDFY